MNEQPKTPLHDAARYHFEMAQLVPHPLSEIFPMMEGPDFDGLKASIAAHGIREPIVIFEGNKILDGRNRHKAAKEVIGFKFQPANFRTFDGTAAQAEAFVIAVNVHRRHLKPADKEALVRLMLVRHPNAGNREIGRMCGVSHVTVGKYKAPKVDKACIEFVEKWDNLTDSQREWFGEKYKKELRELVDNLSKPRSY